MAFESHQHVFLGEDLMNAQRDYSDDTARVIDEEIELLLRAQEDRAKNLLHIHRKGLDLVAKGLLEKETLDGAEVGRLVQQGLAEMQHEQAAASAD